MEDKLKNFVDANRAQFDTEKAPVNSWNNIAQQLDSNKSKRTFSLNQLLLLIGVVLALFTAGIYVGTQIMNEQAEQPAMFAGIQDKEYIEFQNYYGSILKEKEQRFVKVANEKSVAEELNELDAGFRELQSDFVNSASNNREMLLHLMKENYELRIKLLEIAMEKSTDYPSTNTTEYETQEY